MTEILIEQGDITDYAVDAIVNAANNDLILGAGVAGAIARKGGPDIQRECNTLGPLKIGQAALTTGGRLKARYVIHAASMALGGRTTETSLALSVEASLDLAEQKSLRSIAFPAIGTGIAGFPLERCAEIMIRLFLQRAKKITSLEKIFIVLYDPMAYNIFTRTYGKACGNKK